MLETRAFPSFSFENRSNVLVTNYLLLYVIREYFTVCLIQLNNPVKRIISDNCVLSAFPQTPATETERESC